MDPNTCRNCGINPKFKDSINNTSYNFCDPCLSGDYNNNDKPFPVLVDKPPTMIYPSRLFGHPTLELLSNKYNNCQFCFKPAFYCPTKHILHRKRCIDHIDM